MEITTRHPRIEEIPALHGIWKTVFGGDDETVFFKHYLDPETCVIVAGDIGPVAAGYLLPYGKMVSDGCSFPCAMIYGVSTLPQYRNRGFGAAVVRDLITAGYNSGYHAIVLCPSDDDLFTYYSTHTQLQDRFFVYERRFTKPAVSNSHLELTPVTSEEYADLRSSLLAGTTHIEADLHALNYQKLLCREFGGGLLRADTQYGASCAVVERQNDGRIWVKELLTPACTDKDDYEHTSRDTVCNEVSDSYNDVVEAIIKAFPANEYIVRSPVQSKKMTDSAPAQGIMRSHDCGSYEETGVRRFGMLASSAELLDACRFENDAPWLGLAFD